MSYIKLKTRLRYSHEYSHELTKEYTHLYMMSSIELTMANDLLYINSKDPRDYKYIVNMEVSRDILLIMENELRAMPFNVDCPENDEFNKVLKEAESNL